MYQGGVPMSHESTMSPHQKPEVVNWTITPQCNYHCQYCFARFPELAARKPLPNKLMLRIPQLLAEAGCEKLTFVGGEPFLCSILPKLLEVSHDLGLTTMIVTNGTLLDINFLKRNHKNIDWISLSIDSQYEDVQQTLGRGNGNHIAQTINNGKLLTDFNIKLKLNSVITQLNYRDDMREFIDSFSPERWKAFQVLPVGGQNDDTIGRLTISSDEFAHFRQNHQFLKNAIFEDNQAMRGSYLMLSPFGEFFTNTSGHHEYGPSILDVGIEMGLKQCAWDVRKLIDRGGKYSWG